MRHICSKPALLITAAAFLALSSWARAATFTAQAQSFSPFSGSSGGSGFQFAQISDPGTNGASGSATAVANVKHVGIQSTANSPPSSSTILISAQATTDDTFTIAATNAQSTIVSGGTFTALVSADWQISVTPNASADFGWTISVGSQTFGHAHLSTSGSESHVVTVPWTAGSPISVHFNGNGFTDSSSIGSSSDIEFLNGADWGGITGVFDSDGNPVNTFTALGADGITDYSTAATPEPAALLPVALALLAGMARRRPSSR